MINEPNHPPQTSPFSPPLDSSVDAYGDTPAVRLPKRMTRGSADLARAKADPLGLMHFPQTRADLHAMVDRTFDFVRRHATNCSITGRDLALVAFPATDRETKSADLARALRRLLAYSRIWLHRPEIVGVPGSGYFWGPADPKRYAKAINDSRARARDYLALASIYSGNGVPATAAQLMLDFMRPSRGGDHADDLAAMLAAEDIKVADFLDALIKEMTKDDVGSRELAKLATRHEEALGVKTIVARKVAERLQSIQDQAAAGLADLEIAPKPGLIEVPALRRTLIKTIKESEGHYIVQSASGELLGNLLEISGRWSFSTADTEAARVIDAKESAAINAALNHLNAVGHTSPDITNITELGEGRK